MDGKTRMCDPHDADLATDLRQAARCAAQLEALELHVAFVPGPTGLEIVLEHLTGEAIRQLSVSELLELATVPGALDRLADLGEPALAGAA